MISELSLAIAYAPATTLLWQALSVVRRHNALPSGRIDVEVIVIILEFSLDGYPEPNAR